MLAGTSPEVLIAAVGAATSGIRVGSGGVMLPHYSPLKVAEVFSVLSGLYGDRIDLAVGRAPGSDRETMIALQRDRRQLSPDDFPEQLSELIAYVHDRFPGPHPFARLAALPGLPHAPALWLLGSSAQSAIWAAEAGLPYAFADFINPNGAAYAREYRASFEPSPELERPYVLVASSVVCADTVEEAERLASSSRMAFLRLRQGRPIPVPPVEKALAWFAGRDAAGATASAGRRLVVGEPATVRERLLDVAAAYGADELMVVTITYDHEARRRSYELLADAFGLQRR